MKRRKALKGILAFGSLSFSPFFLTAAPKKDTNVYLIVDTANINPANVDQYVQISDNMSGICNTGSASSFSSQMHPDKWISWEGQVKDMPANPDDEVEITGIVKVSGPDLIKSPKYKDGKALAKIKKNYILGDMKYNIQFRVFRNNSWTNYEVDPKLKMRPPTLTD